LVTAEQLKLWEWMAEYYLADIGSVMNAALPASLKLESETKLMIHPFFDHKFDELNDREFLVAEALTHHKEVTIEDIQKILGIQSVHIVIRSLIEKNIIVLKEELGKDYKPKEIDYVILNPEYNDKPARQ